MYRFKHPLLRQLQKDLASSKQNMPHAGRREFLKKTGIVASGVLLGASLLHSCKGGKNKAKVAVVGGGLAGLTAVRTLEKNGISADLFEASERLGGRVRSQKGLLGENLVTELGGEFIDSDHFELLELVKEFGLELIDLAQDPVSEAIYYIDGKPYSYTDCLAELDLGAAGQFMLDMSTLPEYIESGNVHLWRLYDSVSLEAYFAALELKPWFCKLLTMAYEAEFGLDAGEQSAMNFMTLFEPEAQDFLLYGASDKRYKIKGGNELLVQKLAQAVSTKPQLGHVLTRIDSGENNQGVKLTFDTATGQKTEEYLHVIVALPYSILRKVEITAPLSEVRKAAIKELSYGTNSKVFMGFHEAVWRNHGFSGDAFTNFDFQCVWDNTRMQGQKAAGLTLFSGGSKGKQLGKSDKKDWEETYLAQLDELYAGLSIAYNGQSAQFNWVDNPYSLGSYSCYSTGQWTKFYGSENVDEGNIHFAGEHVSRIWQGYMNGAVETGIAAAERVLGKMSEF